MTVAQPAAGADQIPGDYHFTDADFQTIAAIAHKRYGLHLQASKKPLVYSRLTKRLRALGLPHFESYCALLSDAQDQDEHAHLLSALTTNVTHFFRERHHFTYLREKILPALIQSAKGGNAVRIWSSACSAGQEAYCIAAMIRDACPEAGRLDIKVLATDVDPQIIQKARRGHYDPDQADAIPQEYQSLMIEGAVTASGFQIKAELRSLVTFGEVNLIADWPMRRRFDVIFCRNAAIYFDKDTQTRLWQRFADVLNDGGHLMIGHSERLTGPAEAHFRSAGITTYQRLPRATGRQPVEIKD
ncbi:MULTISPECIES: protein-glutamate O-methyltransferase [unclassified Yoonia]|uniref:CheR family methyltransferase n=1 Tax=unclassified Yoonia TaxID=2629118 RepID=UPI002AFEC157|nr:MULTISPECIES: protein-glutamate O-methyltransferase [unclassified Yoonia]